MSDDNLQMFAVGLLFSIDGKISGPGWYSTFTMAASLIFMLLAVTGVTQKIVLKSMKWKQDKTKGNEDEDCD